MPRLDPTLLATWPLGVDRSAVRTPGFDRDTARVGIVHLGVGAFHRSHQAVFAQRLLRAGHGGWGICGVGVLEADAGLHDRLVEQDCLYTLVLQGEDDEHPTGVDREVVGSLLEHLVAPHDPEAVLARLAAPTTRLVTLTITEGGYGVDKTTGELVPDEAMRADVRPGAVPRTAFGLLLEGLRRRREAGTPAYAVVSCDNLPHNGDLTRHALGAFARLADAERGTDLADWVAEHVAFPNSMVDRITPATTDADRERLRAATGIEDACPVVAEPFVQWVLEDRFLGERPPLEEVGVELVDDVAPYELMKLRLLNASHQVLGYLGHLAGHRHVDAACADPDFAALVRRWMDREARPTLPEVPGTDLDAYCDTLQRRFANPAVSDTLARLCAQGAERLATFVVPVVRDQLAVGGPLDVAALTVAGWIRYVQGRDEQGGAIEVVDDRWPELAPVVEASRTDPAALLGVSWLFGEVGADPRFRDAVAAAVARLEERGAAACVAELAGSPRVG